MIRRLFAFSLMKATFETMQRNKTTQKSGPQITLKAAPLKIVKLKRLLTYEMIECADLFSNNFERKFNNNFFVQTNCCCVFAKFLNIADFDKFAVNIVAKLFESFSKLNCVD